ncbi:hypothetical protein PISMIDRAFT_646616 [Pisolithus microcarpus 441]|uniref:Uncharacterized protein n=1 Tax=Pisolithus microcarpus 441 TaxID=765257 RepID=A0A0C9Z4U9_9AGAM|nr:hypothetical protein PISMIDRAFT_646616 [Pisolithus microcarpus 441]
MSSNTNTITNNSMQLVEDNNITNNMQVVIEESNNTNNMQVVIEDTNTSNMQCDDNSTDKNNNNSVVENKEESTKENDKDIILKQLMPDPSMGPSVAEELAAVINSAGDQQQSVLAMHKKAKKSIKSRAQGSQDKIQMEVQGNVAAVKRGLEPDSEEEVTGEMARNTTDATEMQSVDNGSLAKSKYKCSKHARDQDQSMARREPVLVVNRVREMAVVQQPEDDMEEQGAQVQPRRRQSLFPRGDNLIPNIKVTEPTEADELKFAVETAIADVTLGYALMTVIHDQADQRCDLNRGPILKLREYNPRPINDKYLAQLKKSIGARGLQSKTQILLCKYILDVFTFLAAPVEVKILGLTIDAAEKEEKDVEKQCRKVARAMMAEARASTYFAWGLVDDFAEKSLMIWADVMKSSKHDHPWRLWGLKDRASRELWNNLLDKYWRRLLSEGMSMGHEIQVNKDTSPDDRIQVAFKNKLEWVRGGHLLDTTYPLSFGSMPLGNRLMFNNIQRLFTDLTSTPKLDLSLAIKEVVSWVEPFVTLSSMQRGDRVWRDYMRAMTANMMRCGKSIGIVALVTDFFITERPKLQVFTKYLASVQEQVKVYDASNLHTELLEKKFLERLQKIINQYHEQVESWSRATPVPTYLRPEPNQTVSFENLTEQQEKVAQGIIQMMRVTAFPKDHYKGMEQLVKALAPMTLNEASRQLLLATEVGWALRHKLANIMQGCRGAQQHWVWYDGIQDRPYCKNGLDASDEMSCMDIGETRDNWANRITMESELFAQNKRKVKELQKILFSNQLGLLNNGALPEDLWLAADTMLKCIVRESERHIGRLSIPLQDIMGVDWTDQALEDYGVKMPPMATQNEVKMYWGVKQGADLEPLRNIGTFKQTDKQMVNMECIASAKVKRKEEKEIKEVEKATLFVPRDRESVKLQAKMARLKKKEAEEKANCQVADFDKRMVEEEQQQQQVLSAGPYKRTGENLRALKFSKVKRGHKRAKSSGLLKQTVLNTWVIYAEEDESGDMDVDDMSKQQQQSSEPEGDNTSSSSEVVARNKRLSLTEVHYSKEEFQVHQMVKNFVSTEAKLSRGNPSSDESEDTEDGYEAAFIDDSTQKGQESSEENESKATAEATDSSDDSDTDIDGSEEGDGKSMEDISQLPKNDGNGGRELTEIDTSTDSSQDDGYGTSLINTMTRVPESMLKECQEAMNTVDAEGISQRMSHFSMDAEGQDK